MITQHPIPRIPSKFPFSLSVAHHLISLNSSTAHTSLAERAQAPLHALRGKPTSPSIRLANNRNPWKKADLTAHFSTASDPGERVLANPHVANYVDYGEAVSLCEEPGTSTNGPSIDNPTQHHANFHDRHVLGSLAVPHIIKEVAN